MYLHHPGGFYTIFYQQYFTAISPFLCFFGVVILLCWCLGYGCCWFMIFFQPIHYSTTDCLCPSSSKPSVAAGWWWWTARCSCRPPGPCSRPSSCCPPPPAWSPRPPPLCSAPSPHPTPPASPAPPTPSPGWPAFRQDSFCLWNPSKKITIVFLDPHFTPLIKTSVADPYPESKVPHTVILPDQDATCFPRIQISSWLL